MVEKARERCIKKFLRYFKKGYKDQKYIDWERQYKLDAHLSFYEALNREKYLELLKNGKYAEIAMTAVKIESRTNLLFSFEKMALRDALKSGEGAKLFATGLYDYVYGKEDMKIRFERFVDIIARLPRKQTRVLTWPLVTVFGFIGNPYEHLFLKPRVTQAASVKYQFDFTYLSKPNWETYKSLHQFAAEIKKDTKLLHPRDFIDLQSFIWVMGSDEYPS